MKPIVSIAFVMAAAACVPQRGTLAGVVEPTAAAGVGRGASEAVEFQWASTTEYSGNIEGSLPDGEGFEGHYRRIHVDEVPEDLVALYGEWYGDWPHERQADWAALDGPADLAGKYTDHALAVLTTAKGDRMRCDFVLAAPRQGLGGGADGRCQMLGGAQIKLKVPDRTK